MQVFIELAFAENFCMDFVLLYAAKALTKNRCKVLRLAFASVVGASFAVLFPLFNISGAAAIAIKLASGVALAAIAGASKSLKDFIKFSACFLVLTFVLGGALIAIFSLADIKYEEGGGFLISSVPIGIPLFAALILFFAVKRLARLISAKCGKKQVNCRIFVGECSAEAIGFYDSGNRVYYLGKPVSVIPAAVAQKLIEVERIKSFAEIHTVAGSKKIAIFTADKVEIDDGEKVKSFYKVKLGVSPHTINRAVLHPDLAEVN